MSRIASYGELSDLDRSAELDVEAVGEHLELELADGGQHRGAVAHVGVAEDLDNTLLVELGEAAAELLEPAGVERPRRREDLR